ncbi:MAG: hypothetical protein KGM43_02620 [Planctomycetota bacterium]|nr:hypothetical protein [Planctomycetota bacterium]
MSLDPNFDATPERNAVPAIEPWPAGPRTIGFLNLTLCGFLLLCGGFCLNTTGVRGFQAPTTSSFGPAEANAVIDSAIDSAQTSLDASKNDAEKKEAKQAITQLQDMKKHVDTLFDYPKVNGALHTLATYFRWDVATGPLLNLLMVISGIGLFKLASWARKLAILAATLKLLRLVALSVYTFTAVVPAVDVLSDQFTKSEPGRAVLGRMIEEQKAKGNAIELEPKEFKDVLIAITSSYSIAMLVMGSIYPIIVLIVLTRRGAKAACEMQPLERFDEFE